MIITCEHAGNEIPDALREIFNGHTDVLNSHRGWDPGAWQMAMSLATGMNAPLFGTHVSRLVVEANRSLDNAQLFSDFTLRLDDDQKTDLLASYYLPYRERIETAIQHMAKPVLHLSIHSFTPRWNGAVRKVDIGLLFDPSRKNESEFCQKLQTVLRKHLPELQILLNEPYLGIDDGFTTYLRTKFNDASYSGIEIEVNQKFEEAGQRAVVDSKVLSALKEVLK